MIGLFRRFLSFLGALRRARPALALSAGEQSYRALFDNSMDAILLMTPDGRIEMANRAATEMFGYGEQELRELGRAALIDESDPRVAAALEERNASQRFRGDLTMKRKDGSRVHVELSCTLFIDDRGVEWTSTFVRDVTRRKLREAERERLLEELEAERRWFRAVLEHVPVAVYLFEPSGRIAFNAKTEELLGIKLSPLAGAAQYRDRILYPDGRHVPPEELASARALRTGEVVNTAAYLVQRPDGTRVPVITSAGPIRDASGKTIGCIVISQDVAERERAEAAVKASERLLTGVFQLLPVGVWIADEKGHIVRCNPAAEKIWGGTRLVPPPKYGEYRARWADTGRLVKAHEWALARALEHGETSLGELLEIECFDGTHKTVINSALPLYDDAGRFAGAIAVNEDVTALHQAQGALQRALGWRDRVLSIVAHDLRGPLNIVHLQLQFLLQAHERRTDHTRALDRMGQQVQRMNRLIEDLLDVTRIESGTLRLQRAAAVCGQLIDEVLTAYQPIATEAGVELIAEVRPGVREIDADAGRIVQVLNNLVGNALKFTPAGGRITIGARPLDEDVLFWVRDTGAGMDIGRFAHIFDPLWQGQPDRRGIGLGLPIAKAIVEAHGGRVWADSVVGRGSTFYFSVPVALAASAARSTAAGVSD